jgi:hypothetical protein
VRINVKLCPNNINENLNPRGDLDFESLARSCLARGAHQLSPDQIKFIGGLLQQIPWCGLTTEQSNDYLISQSW